MPGAVFPAYPVDLFLLLRDVAKASSRAATSPSHCIRRAPAQAVLGVAFDLQQAGCLLRRDAWHQASDAGVFVLAGRALGAVAGAEGDLAELEVVPELAPFGVSGLAVFVTGPLGAALVDEPQVAGDDLFGIDG
jgi:hypothetical protein